MKIQLLVLLFFFALSDGFSQAKKSKPAFTNVHHNLNNITVTNFDGDRSTIYSSGNSATLYNVDGSFSTINTIGNSSNLIAADGTQSSVVHNGLSSTVINSDGTQFFVSHKRNSSSCSTKDGSHTVSHVFASVDEMCYKNQIDVLIQANWFLQQKQLASVELENTQAKE